MTRDDRLALANMILFLIVMPALEWATRRAPVWWSIVLALPATLSVFVIIVRFKIDEPVLAAWRRIKVARK